MRLLRLRFRAFLFKIVLCLPGTQTFHLKASSEVERQRWVTALELAKAKAITLMESGEWLMKYLITKCSYSRKLIRFFFLKFSIWKDMTSIVNFKIQIGSATEVHQHTIVKIRYLWFCQRISSSSGHCFAQIPSNRYDRDFRENLHKKLVNHSNTVIRGTCGKCLPWSNGKCCDFKARLFK